MFADTVAESGCVYPGTGRPFGPRVQGMLRRPLTMELSVELERIARENDVAYVDAIRWLGTGGDVMSPDSLHPTAQGQQQLALRMGQELERLDLVSPEA